MQPAAPPSTTPNLWVLPAKQDRSRQTRDRLLAAGRELLEQGGFEETSIAQVARQAGCSVGSFYVRFADKRAFYKAVISAFNEECMAQVTQGLNRQSVAGLSAAATVEACVDVLLAQFHHHAGLLRTVQRQSIRHSEARLPVQRLGHLVVTHMVDLVEHKHGEQGNPVFRHHLEVGFQIALSIMLNGTVNRPALLNPDNPDYGFWIKEMVLHALSLRHAPMADAAYRAAARRA